MTGALKVLDTDATMVWAGAHMKATRMAARQSTAPYSVMPCPDSSSRKEDLLLIVMFMIAPRLSRLLSPFQC
ncbi:MAG: hypothetical protein AB7W16_28115 [Candidatus Obscuribacterales bacterium]